LKTPPFEELRMVSEVEPPEAGSSRIQKQIAELHPAGTLMLVVQNS
jgi:hypothetical protein